MYDGNPNNEPVDIVCPGCKRSNLAWIDRGDGLVECPRPECEHRFWLYPMTSPITSNTELTEAGLRAENEMLRGLILAEQEKYERAVVEMEQGLLELYNSLRTVQGQLADAQAAELALWGQAHA